MSREKILCGKEEIFRVAIAMVDREGIGALSVRSVAKELGVSPMTIYNYVENLNDIKKRVLINGFDRLYAFLYDNLNKLPSPVDKFTFCREIALCVYDFAVNNSKLFVFMFSEGQHIFSEDAEVRPFYTYIYKMTRRSNATRQDWEENKKGYRLLEMLIFSVSYQVASGAQTLTEAEYGDLIEFYLHKCLN